MVVYLAEWLALLLVDYSVASMAVHWVEYLVVTKAVPTVG